MEDETDACILALWEDGTTYQEFMKHTHDSIFIKASRIKHIRIWTFQHQIRPTSSEHATIIIEAAPLKAVI